MIENIAEAIKEMGDWNEAALLDRIIVWDRWIEKGIAPDGTKEARDAATQIIIERVNRLRRALRALADIDGSPANVANAEVLASRVRNCARATLGEDRT